MSRSGFYLWWDINNLQIYKLVGSKHIKEVFDIEYIINNYIMMRPNIRPKIKLWKIRVYLIIDLEKYNI